MRFYQIYCLVTYKDGTTENVTVTAPKGDYKDTAKWACGFPSNVRKIKAIASGSYVE